MANQFNNITNTQDGVQALLTYNKELSGIYKNYLMAAKKLLSVVTANAPQMGDDEGLVTEKVGGLANQLIKITEGDTSGIKVAGQYSKVEGARIAKLLYHPTGGGKSR